MAFVTDVGRPVPALTAAQMREVDRVAVEETGPNLYQMMENAGRNLAELTLALNHGDTSGMSVLVLAGTGGNGGGGITAARHLVNRGAPVWVSVTSRDRLSGVPLAQYQLYLAAGGRVFEEDRIADPSVVVDAVIGYSLGGVPRGAAAELILAAQRLGAAGSRVVSLDVPSGVDATTGQSPGIAIAPDVTMTLALPKTGLVGSRTGELFLADIGIPIETFRRSGIDLPGPVFDARFVLPISPAESGG